MYYSKKFDFKIFLLITLLSFFCVLPLTAQEENNPSGTISQIEVIGLRRTRPHVAHNFLERFLGREASSLDLNEVYAVIRDTGILELEKAELIQGEDGIILRVTVEEKWTFFPFPVFMAGSGAYNFGLYLVDTNAFGQRDQMALGAMYGSSGFSGMAFYNHSPMRRGLPGWNTSLSYGRRENRDLDRDENIHRRYTTDRFRFSLGLGYSFNRLLSASASFSFADTSIVQTDNDINPPGDGARHLGFSPGLSLRQSSWDGFLLSQRSLSLRYGYNYAIKGYSWHQADLRLNFEQPLVPGFRLNLRSGAVWIFADQSGRDDESLVESGPGSAQVDILPRNYSARHYAGFSAGFEKHIIEFPYGSLSALASWQCVFSHGPIQGDDFNHGPSGGIRFYLSRVALPAMGINLAYNMNSGLYQVAFNMGMEF